jgi:hypothetical protein
MKRTLVVAMILMTIATAASSASSSDVREIAAVLDDLHDAADKGDGVRYFSHFTDNAVFLGTDPYERWTLSEFRARFEHEFNGINAWTYLPRERQVAPSDSNTAWFDEKVESPKYGELRGTGVLVKFQGAWKIAQYNLTLPIPNAIFPKIVEMVKSEKALKEKAFRALHESYVVEFLKRNPTVNTYLGGAELVLNGTGPDPLLQKADGRLRNHSAMALEDEDRWLDQSRQAFDAIDPDSLSPNSRIDHAVALAQIRFLLHQHQVRRYQERALDTYIDEPVRTIDFQLQVMTSNGTSNGTFGEWAQLASRLGDIPRFLSVAEEQLAAGVISKNWPDWRVLRQYGIKAADDDVKYFRETLISIAEQRLRGSPQLLDNIRRASGNAADAYERLRNFVARTFFDDPLSETKDGSKDNFRMIGSLWGRRSTTGLSKTISILTRRRTSSSTSPGPLSRSLATPWCASLARSE